MKPRDILRVEGFVVLSLSLAAYLRADGSVPLLAMLALAPDLSILGYLVSDRFWSAVYNVFHTYTVPLAVGAAALYLGVDLPVLVAAVWTGHIGADRALGYGLKYSSGFGDTHLSPPVTERSPED